MGRCVCPDTLHLCRSFGLHLGRRKAMNKNIGKCKLCGADYSTASRGWRGGRPPVYCEACSTLSPYQRAKKKERLVLSLKPTSSDGDDIACRCIIKVKSEHDVQQKPLKKRSIKLLGSNSTGYVIPTRKEKESTVKAKEPDDACPRCGMWYTPWSQSLPHGAGCPDCVMTHASANSIIELVETVTTLLER